MVHESDCERIDRESDTTRAWCSCEDVHLCSYSCEDGCDAAESAECISLSCAEHNGGAVAVTILPEPTYVRMVAAPAPYRRRRSRYVVSGRPVTATQAWQRAMGGSL